MIASGTASALTHRSLDLDVLGTAMRVRFSDEITDADIERITESWSRCRTEDPSDDPIDVLATTVASSAESPDDESVRVVRAGSVAQLEESLTSTLTVIAIGEGRETLTMLHACGVADEDGHVLAFVAASGTGKTTASRTLGRSFGYVTDETVAVDAAGAVVPYPKPLSVKSLTEVVPKSQVSPDALGLRMPVSGPLALTAVVLLDRRDDSPADAPTLEEVGLFDAMCEIVLQTSYLGSRRLPLQHLARFLADRGGALRVVYSEAESLRDIASSLFARERHSLDISDYEPLDTAVEQHEFVGERIAGDRLVRRTAAGDAIAAPDGEMLLFVDNSVVRLAGVAPALWAAASEWRTETEIVRAVRDVVGPAPADIDEAAVVRAAIDELATLRVIETEEIGSNGHAAGADPGATR